MRVERISDPARAIHIDGEAGDWPAGAAAVADGHSVYVRFWPGTPDSALQAADHTLMMLLDLDGSTFSGHTEEPWDGAMGLGIDLEIQISPTNPPDGPRSGVALALVDSAGRRRPISHADADFMFAPTYASEWYELRVARQVADFSGWRVGASADAVRPVRPGASPTPTRALLGTHGAGVIALLDSAGEQVASLPPFAFDLPALRARDGVQSGDPAIMPPARRNGAMRIMSANVRRSGPGKDPMPFVRTIRAMDPDAIAFQEWDADAETIRAWFEQHMGEAWNVVSFADQGVAIASRGEVVPLIDEPLLVDGRDYPVRCIAARVRTSMGDCVVASVHLKCCGGAFGEEDRTRMKEALAINEFLRHAREEGAEDMALVIAGDLNLVGSRPPMDTLREGLNHDGSDLHVARAEVVGDASTYTWREAGSAFSPGRLDYILHSGRAGDALSAFVLDTQRLAPGVLASLELESTDALASDHRPLIVDLRVQEGGSGI